jgi:hypothetical protein
LCVEHVRQLQGGSTLHIQLASFLGLAGIALLAFVLLWLALPETVNKDDQTLE